MENKESNWKGSPYREIFENNLRSINDRKSINNLIMVWVDQSVNEHNAELLERYKRLDKSNKRLKLIHELFIGKVVDELGFEKTTELLKRVTNAIDQALNTNTNK